MTKKDQHKDTVAEKTEHTVEGLLHEETYMYGDKMYTYEQLYSPSHIRMIIFTVYSVLVFVGVIGVIWWVYFKPIDYVFRIPFFSSTPPITPMEGIQPARTEELIDEEVEDILPVTTSVSVSTSSIGTTTATTTQGGTTSDTIDVIATSSPEVVASSTLDSNATSSIQ